MNWQHWNFFSLHSSDGIVLFAFELRNLSNFQDFYFDALFCGLNECSNSNCYYSIWGWPAFCVIMPPAMMVIMLPTSTCQRAGYPTHVQTSILNGYYIRISVKFILLCTCTLTPFKCGAFWRYSKIFHSKWLWLMDFCVRTGPFENCWGSGTLMKSESQPQ